MKQEIYEKEYIQDILKGKVEKCLNYLKEDRSSKSFLLPIICLILIPPLFFVLYFPVLVHLVWHNLKGCPVPFFLPITSGKKVDTFNRSPVKGPEGEAIHDGAAGIAYFGNVNGSNEQAWMSNSMLRQHIAFLATTGSGKTFTISGIACVNALIWGAGYLYVDAKADLDIIRMHWSFLWRMNRIDDALVLNYIQGSRTLWDGFLGDKTTNTYNLLEKGTPGQNTETTKSLMDGDGDIWAKRAESLLSALMSPLCFMRDQKMITLSVVTMVDYLTVESAGGLIGDKRIPEYVKKDLAGFIKTLPGMSNKFYEQIIKGESVGSTQVYDQWGFASMQIILVINTLAGDYGSIFGVSIGEIDLEAIVLQDRVMIGLLPALEASVSSVASMGRIIMAARKGMMGRSLGERIEGSVKRNLKQLPTNAPYPYINVLDEVGMMFAQGEGASAAQSRGLGYSQWYSAQDLPAMKKLGEDIAKEVMTVLGNTVTKIAGKIMDDESYEAYSKLFGEHFVWQRDRTDISYSSMTGSQRISESSGTYVKENRLDKREVQRLREGEIMISAVDRLYRLDGPNLHPKSLDTLMLNDFVMMTPYPLEVIEAIIDEQVYLQAEYELIVSGKRTTKQIPDSDLCITEIPKFEFLFDTIPSLIEDRMEAISLSFAKSARLSAESLYQAELKAEETKAAFHKALHESPDSNPTDSISYNNEASYDLSSTDFESEVSYTTDDLESPLQGTNDLTEQPAQDRKKLWKGSLKLKV